MSDPVVILIVSAGRAGLFNARLADGRVLATGTATPFLAGCRRLIELGFDPARPVVMRHAGSVHDALKATIGAAAKLTVRETVSGPKLGLWSGPRAEPGAPPMRQTDVAATQLAGGANAAPAAA